MFSKLVVSDNDLTLAPIEVNIRDSNRPSGRFQVGSKGIDSSGGRISVLQNIKSCLSGFASCHIHVALEETYLELAAHSYRHTTDNDTYTPPSAIPHHICLQ
jgi:hypothetical protein